MKKLTLIILAVALAATATTADDYYLCYTPNFPPRLIFAKIPGPGSHSDLDIVHSVSIPNHNYALTYDGENWWIYNDDNDSIYCFDQNGDYVRDFPAPGANGVVGLAWDGQYLWIKPSYEDTCTRDIYGNAGPYGPFWTGYQAHTIVNDVLLTGDDAYGILPGAVIYAHDFFGNYLFWGASTIGYSHSAWVSLAYHDGIVWATEVWDDSDYFIYMNTVGFIYDNNGNWKEYAKVNDVGLGNMTICDADCINIAETSFGKIKAYFADK